MRNDLTDMTVVLDRSGSMASCKDDAEGGLNHLVQEQKKQPGHALYTLVQFDTEYEFVHRAIPLRDVPPCRLVPRGSTALLDAVGRAIAETGERLHQTPEPERPGLVVFVIVTDGQENSSHEFSKMKIKEMIELQQGVYKWQFTFLGANQDAFAEAGGMGIHVDGALNYANVLGGFRAASANVGRMRKMASEGQTVVNAYTEQEREEAVS